MFRGYVHNIFGHDSYDRARYDVQEPNVMDGHHSQHSSSRRLE
jgi:hypothetical protein